MGKLCIIGVDDNKVLKDFVRAHVELLEGEKVLISHWFPDYAHEGRTIRVHWSTHPWRRKVAGLLPQFLYRRLVARHERSEARVHDALTAFFRHHRVDCILAEFGPTGAEIAPYAERLGIPLIVHFHGHDAHRTATVEPLRAKYQAMFRSAFRIISVSRYMTGVLVAMGCPPEKVVTNPYGPRDEYFGIQPDYRPTVLALGRFTDIKANHLTLMAFREALRACPDAHMVMAGDGELLEACRTLAGVWGLADRVSFPGAVPHAENRRLFAEACCFAQHSVMPSYGDAEGTPVAILEAQAAGLPVISTRHAGITDAVVDGRAGFLLNERDVSGMAAAMVRLLSDRSLSKSMGAAAREHIRRSFSMQRHIGCLQGILDEAGSNGRV